MSRRLILSKSMKLVEKSTNFYKCLSTGQVIKSEDVMSWAELNWIVARGGLSKSFLAEEGNA